MCEFSGDIFPNPESHGGQLSRKFAAGFFRMNKWGCPGLSKLCLSICLYSIWVHIGPDRTREAPKWWPPGVQPWDQQDAEDTGSSWRHTCCAMDSTRMRGERRPLATCGPSQDIGQLAFGPELSNRFFPPAEGLPKGGRTCSLGSASASMLALHVAQPMRNDAAAS